MRVGLIRNGKCENVIVVESIADGVALLGDTYEIYECPLNFGIGDLCYEGSWFAGGQGLIKVCPNCQNYVSAASTICPVCNYEFTEA